MHHRGTMIKTAILLYLGTTLCGALPENDCSKGKVEVEDVNPFGIILSDDNLLKEYDISQPDIISAAPSPLISRLIHQGHNLFFRPQISMGLASPDFIISRRPIKTEDVNFEKDVVPATVNVPEEPSKVILEEPLPSLPEIIPPVDSIEDEKLIEVPEAPVLPPLVMPQLPELKVQVNEPIPIPEPYITPSLELIDRSSYSSPCSQSKPIIPLEEKIEQKPFLVSGGPILPPLSFPRPPLVNLIVPKPIVPTPQMQLPVPIRFPLLAPNFIPLIGYAPEVLVAPQREPVAPPRPIQVIKKPPPPLEIVPEKSADILEPIEDCVPFGLLPKMPDSYREEFYAPVEEIVERKPLFEAIPEAPLLPPIELPKLPADVVVQESDAYPLSGPNVILDRLKELIRINIPVGSDIPDIFIPNIHHETVHISKTEIPSYEAPFGFPTACAHNIVLERILPNIAEQFKQIKVIPVSALPESPVSTII